MATVRKGRIGPGTVFRIRVAGEADGVALVTHRHPEFHDLIRVFGRRVGDDDAHCERVTHEESPLLSGFTSVRTGIKQGVFVRLRSRGCSAFAAGVSPVSRQRTSGPGHERGQSLAMGRRARVAHRANSGSPAPTLSILVEPVVGERDCTEPVTLFTL